MKSVLAVVYIFHLKCQMIKSILTLFKIKKDIPRAISILMSINKKIFFKNQDFLFVSSIENETMITLKEFKLKLLIF